MRTIVLLAILTGLGSVLGAVHGPKETYERIRILAKQKDPELGRYLKSLTPDDALSATRYCCVEAAAYPDRTDSMRGYAADVCVATCLQYYFDRQAEEEAGRQLLRIVEDAEESCWLRFAIIGAMHGSESFQGRLATYVAAHVAEVEPILGRILEARTEEPMLRLTSLTTLASLSRQQMSDVCAADPHVAEMRRQTGKVLRIGKLVQTGELTLETGTWDALKPIENRIVDHAKTMRAIAIDEDEPDYLRKHGRRALRSYLKLPLTSESRLRITESLKGLPE